MITNDDVKYVIVQAGGKGTRMGQYAQNRPKCLLPINDIPMIINTLNVYNDKEVIIITDHLSDVLEKYLKLFYKGHNYWIVKTQEPGTAGGLKKAVSFIPDNEPFILTWADLFFEKEQIFSFDSPLLVGLSNTFKCRWRLDDNIDGHGDVYSRFVNRPSTTHGISGFFVFNDKSRFIYLNTDKSLVRGFLTDNYSSHVIQSFYHDGCFEVGDKEKYEEILSNKVNHRFFNKVEIKNDKVYKSCIVPEYENVHQNEKDWYAFVDGKCERTPKVYSSDPLVIQRIDGQHPWEVSDNKGTIIENYCDTFDALHQLGTKSGDYSGECMSVYFSKAWQRVGEVEPLLRYVSEPVIRINGEYCQNPIRNLSVFEDTISGIVGVNEYNVIHGDPTFSNSLVEDRQIWLIDPRGSFGKTKIYGDRRYDWAKLYYSAVGNYDSMNSKKFSVKIKNIPDVELEIASSGYEQYGDMILERSGMSRREMDLIHASLWLSLTGYVKEDVEAALFSFYMGTYLWSTHAIT